MANSIGMLKALGFLSIVVMFGAVFYIRHLAKQKGMWHDFLYSFTGNARFYRDNWRDVRFPLFLMFLAILVLIFVGWCLGRLGVTPGRT